MQAFANAIKNLSEQLEKMEAEEEKDLENFADNLKEVGKEIDKAAIEHRHELKLTKERFNVYDCLPRRHHEDLHSNFLAYLLNPNASHDCGDLFLRLFVDRCVKGKGNFEKTSFELKDIKVKREKHIKEGRIDIYIETKNHIIAIENKIWASDRDKQLKDYHDHLQNNSKENFKENFILFYLTPDGRMPVTRAKRI